MRGSKKRLSVVFGIVMMLALSVAGTAAATTVTVLPSDVGSTWSKADTRSGGTVSFVPGPATAPLGVGSLQMTTTDTPDGSGQAKAQLFNYGYIGTPLADIDALSYYAYKSSTSTNSAAQTMGLNIEVDFVGDGTSYTTLVFEPIYNPGQGSILTDTWQLWDAFDGGNAVWWSSKDIPGVCAFNCFVSWDTILAHNPHAKIIGGLGFNVGSGWVGEFSGNADALTVGVSGSETIYNFEPALTPTSKDQCKKDGWQQFNSPAFKNQGQCVSYVQANAHAKKH